MSLPHSPPQKTPLISVIVPSYNYAQFLPAAVASLQAQTLPDWECVIVDDGSTDDTREVVQNLAARDSRVRCIHQSNAGLSAARNAGLRACAGQFIQFLDADDLLEPRKFEQQSGWLIEHSETDMVYGSARFFPSDNPDERRHRIMGENKPWMPEVSGRRAETLPVLIRENIMPVNCALLRAEVIASVGYFDETLPTIEDWDFWLRCALRDKAFHFQDFAESRALVRFHPASMSQNYRRMMEGYVRVRRKLVPELHEPELAKFNRDTLAFLEAELERIDLMMRELAQIIPSDARFIFVEDGQLEFLGANDPRAIPFLEHHGQFWGSPQDDAMAIREFQRVKEMGAKHLVFAWPAFWWLDYYTAFTEHLRANFPLVLKNERIVVFDLQT